MEMEQHMEETQLLLGNFYKLPKKRFWVTYL